jgi:hypothetical protein
MDGDTRAPIGTDRGAAESKKRGQKVRALVCTVEPQCGGRGAGGSADSTVRRDEGRIEERGG